MNLLNTGRREAMRAQAADRALESLTSSGDVRAWKLTLNEPPLFIAPDAAALRKPGALPNWLRRNRAGVDALLLHHGAIVFRGFFVSNTEEFNTVVAEFEPFSWTYQGSGAPRGKISGEVYEVTQVASPMKIQLHQEMPFIARGPNRIMFFCRKTVDRGGETIIRDMRGITRELPSNLREKLERLGTVYLRNFSAPQDDKKPYQRSWDESFFTDDKAQVEAVCHDKNMEPLWQENGGLVVRTPVPAFSDHPVTGEHVYRNVLHCKGGRYTVFGDRPAEKQCQGSETDQGYETGCYLGDGSELTEEEASALNELFAAAERSWPWEASDIMLLDNLLTAHGRNPFEGARDVQVALLN